MSMQQTTLEPITTKTGKVVERYRQDFWTRYDIYYRLKGDKGPWHNTLMQACRKVKQ